MAPISTPNKNADARFVVYKGHDAWAIYKTIVEAGSAEEASEIASDALYSGKWVATGDISEFDHNEVFPEDTRPAQNQDADDIATERQPYMLSKQEHSTVLAALRFYQEMGMGEPDNRSDGIHEIATCGDAVISLDANGIDDLCERINV